MFVIIKRDIGTDFGFSPAARCYVVLLVGAA